MHVQSALEGLRSGQEARVESLRASSVMDSPCAEDGSGVMRAHHRIIGRRCQSLPSKRDPLSKRYKNSFRSAKLSIRMMDRYLGTLGNPKPRSKTEPLFPFELRT